MEAILDETLSASEIETYERNYVRSLERGTSESDQMQAKFHYAYALVRSSDPKIIKKGVDLLVELYDDGSNEERRDYLYYIAVGQTRLKQYSTALDCVQRFLDVEPQNNQAKQLREFIKERLTKEGLLGMAITGGIVLAVGAAAGIVLSLCKK